MIIRNDENGGVISFVIVSLVLASLLLGGIYLSKSQARIFRGSNTSQPVAIKKNDIDNSKNASPKKTENKESTDRASDSQNTPPPATLNNHSAPQGVADTARDRDSSRPPVANTGPTAVASTGPSDTVMTTAILALLTSAAVAAMQSRRNLSQKLKCHKDAR